MFKGILKDSHALFQKHMLDQLLLREILFSFPYGPTPYTVVYTALTEYTHRIPRHSTKNLAQEVYLSYSQIFIFHDLLKTW
jgi:hypothetical protein